MSNGKTPRVRLLVGGVRLLAGVVGVGFWASSTNRDAGPNQRVQGKEKRAMPQPGFVFVELYTQDIPYYVSLFKSVCGMRLVRDEGGFAEMRPDSAVVLLNADTDADLPEGHPFRGKTAGPGKGVGVEIGIVVADLQTAHRAASDIKGCTVSPVKRQEWGLSDFRILTPDGYYLRVTEPFE